VLWFAAVLNLWGEVVAKKRPKPKPPWSANPLVEDTRHSRERVTEREVKPEHIQAAIDSPDYIGPGSSDFTLRVEKRIGARQTVVVIVENLSTTVKVVSCWYS
jgi:hypothetical protein